jgi:hypothetical protein
MEVIYRAFILKEDFDVDKNNIIEITKIDLSKYEPVKKYKVTKQRYLNVNRIIINNHTKTYSEYFNIKYCKDKFIVFKHELITLNNLEFPQLHKYDSENTYEEQIYNINNFKVVSNKFETYIEFDNYDDLDKILNIL